MTHRWLLNAEPCRDAAHVTLCSAADTVNAVKQAAEFGMTGRQTFVGPAMVINDVHGIGLQAAQGLYLTEGFYWDQNPESRAFAKRFYGELGKMPNTVHSAGYSAVRHYLKAVQAAGTKEADAVMAKKRAMPVDDAFTGHGVLRPDGLMVHDMDLLQVKGPGESHVPWDYLKIVRTVPGADAFAPLSASRCPLVAGK